MVSQTLATMIVTSMLTSGMTLPEPLRVSVVDVESTPCSARSRIASNRSIFYSCETDRLVHPHLLTTSLAQPTE